mmetsp:Transcript_16459/g.18615  ORF Transcript_16459/g.18615 Transcript_16459/m.18615 type:complete len:369 (+) Transcript_16459:216-1322(+)
MNLGWFEDIFELKIEVESDHMTKRHTLLVQDECPLFDSSKKITGKVVVKPPEGSSVWQWGTKLEFEGVISFFETLNTSSVVRKEIDIGKEGYISEETEYEFSIDLAEFKEVALLDSYNGDLFSIGYNLIATIQRPWYTFDVMKVSWIALQSVNPAPEGPDDQGTLGGKMLESGPEAPIRREITINDYVHQCQFKYDRVSYNIGSTLKGELSFKTAKSCPITSAALVFYRIEKGDGAENEVILKEKPIEHESIKAKEQSSKAEEEEKPTEENAAPAEKEEAADNSEADKADDEESPSLVAPIEFIMDGEKLTSGISVADTLDDKAFVSVRYFLRLMIADADGRKYWNTNEVLMYRNVVAGEKGSSVALV